MQNDCAFYLHALCIPDVLMDRMHVRTALLLQELCEFDGVMLGLPEIIASKYLSSLEPALPWCQEAVQQQASRKVECLHGFSDLPRALLLAGLVVLLEHGHHFLQGWLSVRKFVSHLHSSLP